MTSTRCSLTTCSTNIGIKVPRHPAHKTNEIERIPSDTLSMLKMELAGAGISGPDKNLENEEMLKLVYDHLEDQIMNMEFEDEIDLEQIDLNFEPSDVYSYDQEQFRQHSEVTKMMRFLQYGDRSVSVINLVLLNDVDMSSHVVLSTIFKANGLALILNLTQDDDLAVSGTALKLMVKITKNQLLAKEAQNHGGIRKVLWTLVNGNNANLIDALRLLENLILNLKGRCVLRRLGGIPILMGYLQIIVNKPDYNRQCIYHIHRCLFTVSMIRKNRLTMVRHGVPLMCCRLIHTMPIRYVTPIVALYNSCLVEEVFMAKVKDLKMVPRLIALLLKGSSRSLISFSINALYVMSKNEQILPEIAADQFVAVFDKLKKTKDAFIIEAVTGIVARLSINSKKWDKEQDQVIDVLIRLLQKDMKDIKIELFKTLADLTSKTKTMRKIHEKGMVTTVVDNLYNDEASIVQYAVQCVGNAVAHPPAACVINEKDALRKLWSLLKDDRLNIRVESALSLTKCIQHIPGSQYQIRQFIGGLHLLIWLLRATNSDDILTATCTLVAQVSKDDYNLSILTDYNILGSLNEIMLTTNFKLQASIANALAQCVRNVTNKKAFASAMAIGPLLKFLDTDDENIWYGVSAALRELASCPANCVIIYNTQPVNKLLKLIACQDERISYDSAMCLRSLRKIALQGKNEQGRMFKSSSVVPGTDVPHDFFLTMVPIRQL